MYVDDMTVSEVVVRGNRSCALEIAYKVTEWSTQNRVHLNSEKCKELRISFVKDEPRFAPIVVDDNELEMVSSAKLLGLTITSNLTLNEHISEKSVKASVFFSASKKIKSSPAGICPLFTLLVYALLLRTRHPSFFNALLKYLKDELVRVEKRAMSIICPGLPYQEAIELRWS